MEAIRSWFLRDVLDYIERDRGSEALTRLGERLPDRLGEILDPATLRTSAPTETVPIATGEDALLSIESALGDGSGKVLEGIGREMATRFLSHGGAVMTGDLIGTLSRLRVPFEHPFIGVDLTYEIQRTPGGFSMTVGAAGHPRATRILRHLASGAILAAQRYARETGTPKLYGEVRGDRAIIDVVLRATTEPTPVIVEADTNSMRRPSRPSMRAVPQPSLSRQVEEILSRSQSTEPSGVPPRRSSEPPVSSYRRTPGSFPAARPPSEPPPRESVRKPK